MRTRDVVFEQARGSCKGFAIVNDRKLPLAAPLTAEEGRRVMGFLFHCKDEGSSQTSYRRASFQGFSIRASGPVPLPGGISALRCERGPHDPDADHLFARLFYRDRLDEDMMLERLGFSGAEAALFAEIRMSMQGGVIIGGRAGDGKSTTLAVNLALQMAEMEGQLNLVTGRGAGGGRLMRCRKAVVAALAAASLMFPATAAGAAEAPPDLGTVQAMAPAAGPDVPFAEEKRGAAMRLAALGFGARAGLARRGWEISVLLDRHAVKLSAIYRFHGLMLTEGGFTVLPPVPPGMDSVTTSKPLAPPRRAF